MRRGKAPRGPARPPREEGEPIYGVRAALAVLRARPEDVLEVVYGRGVRKEIAPLLQWAGERAVPASELPDPEIAQRAGSSHHEGVCVVARPRRFLTVAELAERLLRSRGAALALDRVRNPYNIGAVLRSAAFFGLEAAILGAPAPHPALPPDAVRVAEGGVEHLSLARTTDLAESLARMRARGVQVVGAESNVEASVFGYRFARPTVLVVGHEREGMSLRVRAQCDALVTIPGAGAVHSLNVAVAAGVLFAELARAR